MLFFSRSKNLKSKRGKMGLVPAKLGLGALASKKHLRKFVEGISLAIDLIKEMRSHKLKSKRNKLILFDRSGRR